MENTTTTFWTIEDNTETTHGRFTSYEEAANWAATSHFKAPHQIDIDGTDDVWCYENEESAKDDWHGDNVKCLIRPLKDGELPDLT